MLSFDSSKPTTSIVSLPGFPKFMSYTSQFEKADLRGKESALASNFESLGSIPETVAGAPNVWGTYFDIEHRHYTAKDIVSDPALSAVFGHKGPAAAAVGEIALEVATAHVHRSAPATKAAGVARSVVRQPSKTTAAPPIATADKPKTDAEIEQEMQKQYRTHRY